MRFFEKLRTVFQEFGALAPLYLLNRLCEGTLCGVYAYRLVAQPVAPRPMLPQARGRTIEVRRMEPGDPDFAGLPLTQAVLDYRFDQGAICFGAFKGGSVIGCIWLCLGPYFEDEVRCRFVPVGASWDFDVYLRPEHRVGFAFARLWDEANAFLRGRGLHWSISRISVLNTKSLAAHDKLGIRTLGTAVFLRIGRFQAMLSSLPPFVACSASNAGAPILVLRAPSSAPERVENPVSAEG
ncbi:MAG TPA: N-acetyltransferase [Alphaproteobacteria bacterium]|nr:N-acetyltransferase [Alphaproteobacteria bacterium]